MEIDSFLLRLLAPTILIDYSAGSDRKARKLQRFEGPSNVPDAGGDNYGVVMEF